MNYRLIYCNKKVPYRTCLRENEHLFRCQAKLVGNLLRFVCAGAYLRMLTERKSCAVGMRNAKLRNHLN